MNLWERFVKFGFRLLYHEMAFTYDMVSNLVSLGEWREWQRAVFDFLPPPEEAGIVLELAHGTGNLQLDLMERGYQTVGLDISAQMGRIAYKRLERQKIQPSLIRASGYALPFSDSQYREIICTFPTNFILQQQTLLEIKRIIKPHGKITIILDSNFTEKNTKTKTIQIAYNITHQSAPQDIKKHIEDKKGSILTEEWHKTAHKKSETTVLILKKD